MLQTVDLKTSEQQTIPAPRREKMRRYTEMCWTCNGVLRMKWAESEATSERHIYECVGCGLERRVAVRG